MRSSRGPVRSKKRPSKPRARPFALVIANGPYPGIQRAEIARRIGAMMDILQWRESHVSFVLTNDEQIQHLNQIYRGKDRPTDVLAFSMREGDFAAFAGNLLGDVIVS